MDDNDKIIRLSEVLRMKDWRYRTTFRTRAAETQDLEIILKGRESAKLRPRPTETGNQSIRSVASSNSNAKSPPWVYKVSRPGDSCSLASPIVPLLGIRSTCYSQRLASNDFVGSHRRELTCTIVCDKPRVTSCVPCKSVRPVIVTVLHADATPAVERHIERDRVNPRRCRRAIR